jgi:cytochrome c553
MEAYLVKKTLPQFVLSLFVLAIGTAAPAQNTQTPALNGVVRTESNSALSQTVPGSLAALPEADTLIFINSRRILNEAALRLMPEKALADMRKTFAEMKQFAGVDPSNVDYIVVAVRFRKPTAELTFMLLEFMAVASGDFSSDSMMVLAKMASEGKLRDEKYGAKTLGLMTIGPIAKEAEKNPILKSFSEEAVVPLNATTIAVGSTAYLKAAIDAEEGNKRISSEQGKELFMTRKGNCIFCHGETGTGNKENLARLRRVPADLSDHKRMPKLSDGEIFWKITKGIPGIMPSREKLTEEERWHLVNFVRSLAKEKPKA